MPSMKLQSSDGEMFEVDVEIAKQSVTIKTMLEGRTSCECRSAIIPNSMPQCKLTGTMEESAAQLMGL